jgi:uncharacterized membrane protein
MAAGTAAVTGAYWEDDTVRGQQEAYSSSPQQLRSVDRTAFRLSPEYKNAVGLAYNWSLFFFLAASGLMLRRWFNQAQTAEVILNEIIATCTASAAVAFHFWQRKLAGFSKLSSRQWWLFGNRYAYTHVMQLLHCQAHNACPKPSACVPPSSLLLGTARIVVHIA